jgi:hypothetical protein
VVPALRAAHARRRVVFDERRRRYHHGADLLRTVSRSKASTADDAGATSRAVRFTRGKRFSSVGRIRKTRRSTLTLPHQPAVSSRYSAHHSCGSLSTLPSPTPASSQRTKRPRRWNASVPTRPASAQMSSSGSTSTSCSTTSSRCSGSASHCSSTRVPPWPRASARRSLITSASINM